MSAPPHAPVGSTEAIAVLEREPALRTIDDALAAAQAGAGSAVLIEGEAGIGKSTLVRYAIDEAGRRNMRVLRAQGGELERSLPHGVITELFGPLVRDEAGNAELFTGPAAEAGRLLGRAGTTRAGTTRPGRHATRGERADPFAYLHGLFWLVLNLAERGPILLAVDDAQWADEPSLRFLHRLVQRVAELPVLVVLAFRPVGDSPESDAGRLLRSDRVATLIGPAPLSQTAVGELLSIVAGRRIDDDLRDASWRATGGNPFFVTELGAELGQRDDESGDAARIGDFVPDRVGRFVEARLGGVGPAARSLAEAVAILGESATLPRAGALAGLGPDETVAVARRLADAGILDRTQTLGFRHPIVRSGVAATIPGPARATLRRRAAFLLADEGAEPDVVGAQLREAERTGDQRTVDLLVAAAQDALARGEPGVAASLLGRALEEPPSPGQRADVLVALARAEAAAGAPTAPKAFAAAMNLVPDATRRAALEVEHGHALLASGQWVAARDSFARALDAAPTADADVRARLEAGYLSSAWVTMDDRVALDARLERILDAPELGPANRELAVWIAFQQASAVTSTAPAMAALVRRALSEAPIRELVREGQLMELATGVLIDTDELPFEMDLLGAAMAAAQDSGPIGKVGLYAYCRGWPELVSGQLDAAIADLDTAFRAAELGWEVFYPSAAALMAMAEIERDDLPAAARALAIDPDRWAGRIDTAMMIPLAEGRLALARGDAAGAAEAFDRARSGAGAAFIRNPVPAAWRMWSAIALIALGRRAEARERATEALEIARAWGAAWPTGAALRVAGVVEGGPAGIDLLREGEALLEDSPARLEHARLLMSLGATLRRNGSLLEAREVLGRAADLARRLGARALLRRASTELRASGGRPRRVAVTGVEALTPGELRVAREALAGRSNREIAQLLFVTPKAVEFHLGNVFRKLGITSRAELSTAMAPRED